MGTFTLASGLGLLATGLIVIAIISTGFLLVTKKIERDRQEEDQRKQWEKKINGSN
tara:strand:+ start:260 stop:427 length:168 start_codon:yes stop_codon:yes gene_type:complete